jgi:large subunit ribosomal protein L9
MKIVLLDDLPGTGNAGEVVTVKNGYARNWLIPQGIGARATADALNRIGLIKRAAESKRAARMTAASQKFNHLADKAIVIRLKTGAGNRVFGAVTASLLADEARIQHGIELDRRQIMLEEPLKQLGDFTVPLRASADVTGELKVSILPQLKKGQTAEQQARQIALQRKAAAGAVEEEAPALDEAAAAEAAEAEANADERIEELAEAAAPEA